VGQTGDGHAFVYDHGHVTILPGIISGGYGGANAINTSGVVVGWAQTSATSYAVMYNHGIMTNLNVWRGPYSVAYDINDSGQVVGEAGTVNYGPRRAFLYKDGTMKDLSTLGGNSSAAFGINNSGQVVGQAAFKPTSSEVHAFLYSNGKMMDLLGPLGINFSPSAAKGINKLGQIVGWYNKPGYGHYAFVYTNGSIHDLNTLLDASGAGWSLSEATAINDHGQIICKAVGHGMSHAVLLTPVPVP
jgi:probable HAF family extracellular repeat protein